MSEPPGHDGGPTNYGDPLPRALLAALDGASGQWQLAAISNARE